MKFVIPACFDPERSLLGRIVRTRAADGRQAEAYLILTVGLLALALLIGGYVGWALVPPASRGLFAGGMAAFVVMIGLSLVGRRPAIVIRADELGLLIGMSGGDPRVGSDRAGEMPGMDPAGDTVRIPYSSIERFVRIDDLTFHRHYRRYAETWVFVNRIPSELLLIRARGVPIIVGLEGESDRAALETLLAKAPNAVRASSWVDVA